MRRIKHTHIINVHPRIAEILLLEHYVEDSSKPLINEIREVAERRLSFNELMKLAYCQPEWQWN